jgi:glycosyltransferase involved in cell wall biosynthesis
MKVLHVISGISRESGGPSRSSQGLVAAQCAAGVDAYIWPLDNVDPWISGGRKVEVIGGGGPWRFKIPSSTSASDLNLKSFDLVHVHGIWDLRLHKIVVACRKARVLYIIAPRGMLEPWSLKQKRLKKRIARFLYQDKDLKYAAALHATAASEEAQFRALGFKNNVIVSPNGVNLPVASCAVEGQRSKVGQRRALFVSRMHKKKGVLELVEAWIKAIHFPTPTSNSNSDWVCELVYTKSSDEEQAYEQQVKDRILALGMSYKEKMEVEDGGARWRIVMSSSTSGINLKPDFILTGSLDDEKKWEAYYRADLFVLPTYSENFGIVVAEALWAGAPVITTKGTPWAELLGNGDSAKVAGDQGDGGRETGRAGWWIDIGVEPLAEALREAMNRTNEERRAMGENGRKLVEAKYTWPAIAEQMKAAYAWILNGGQLPPFVRVS